MSRRMRTVNGNWCEGSEVGRDGILRGAAQKKKGQKKGRLVYEVY